MLFSIQQVMKPRRFFDQPLKGIVVSNADPRGISRVKCSIPPFIVGDVADLPWVYAKSAPDQGGGAGTSSFGVPIVGSELVIEFLNQDPHFPVYTGFWKSATTQQESDSGTNYPNSYGQVDASGNKWITDLTEGTVTFIHSSGSTYVYTKDGDVHHKAARDLVEEVGRNYKLVVTGNLTETITGDSTSTTTGNVVRKGAIINDN